MTIRKRLQVALTFICAFLSAACVFVLCYTFDNKYMESTLPLEDGVLLLQPVIAEQKTVHLVDGWELYRGALLSPEDFSAGKVPSFEQVYIGQYPGFEGSDKTRSPHGEATYRLRIALSPEPKNYTLELPEIYSAYRLYINGALMRQMGNPEFESYLPLTDHSSVTFQAAGEAEIILAVADYSGFYSGLTYPPAFGDAQAVAHLLMTRLFIRLLVCSVALMVGLYYLFSSLFIQNGRLGTLYGLMCLFYVGSISYSVIKTLWANGPLWYVFEDFCYHAMLLCVLLIGIKLTGMTEKAAKATVSIGVLVCLGSLLFPLIIGSSLKNMLVLSYLMNLYSWSAAAFLTVCAAAGAYRSRAYGKIILSGIAVFDCALMMDRLLPNFEPILFGWFTEIAGAALVFSFGIALVQESVVQSRERLVLQGHIESMAELVDLQRRYYPLVLESVQSARAARHDLRHHMSLIRGLASEGNLAGLTKYLKDYHADAPPVHTLSYTENYVADTLLRHFAALAESKKIPFEVQADLPEHLDIPDAELAIVISNLLENALEACVCIPNADACIKISLRCWQNQLCIVVKNSFDGKIQEQNGQLLSRKRKGKAGIGLESVKAAATRLHGSAEFLAEGQIFKASVILQQTTNTEVTT